MAQYYLQHSGVKGMKWGVRRYQNKDGSLTPAGQKRYNRMADRAKKREVHEDYARVHDKKRVSQMSDVELRSRNNRLQMEKQYGDLTKKTSKGKKLVTAYVATAGTISGVAAATATYKKYGNKALDKLGDKLLKDLVIDKVTS